MNEAPGDGFGLPQELAVSHRNAAAWNHRGGPGVWSMGEGRIVS